MQIERDVKLLTQQGCGDIEPMARPLAAPPQLRAICSADLLARAKQAIGLRGPGARGDNTRCKFIRLILTRRADMYGGTSCRDVRLYCRPTPIVVMLADLRCCT
jgi:hypothetical protein